ncbi:DinB family protein [Flagellimonas allohymeniacidonis]|nr:DinB family protein [Allomuricauda hymeniacidonis]
MGAWNARIDKITQEFEQYFDNLGLDYMNCQPNIHTWSIAQNIEHLIVTNESYALVIRSVRQGTCKLPPYARFDFAVDFFGRRVLNAVQSDNKRKLRTFKVWRPGSGASEKGILDRFIKHQSDLKIMRANAMDLVHEKVVIPSPGNPKIVYTLGMAFEIILAHERRHLEQAKRTLEAIR